MTRLQLNEMLFAKQPQLFLFTDSQGKRHIGFLLGIEREDGSGRSFNVTIINENNKHEKFHMRLSD